MREVVIVSAVRTPIGSFGGGLGKTPAVTLGALVIREAIERAGITPDQVDQVIMGNVLQAGLGQNPARQAAIAAGIPHQVPSWTLNMVCGSGLKTVQDGAQAILAGDADVVVVGGMESMSLAPYILDKARTGYHMGNATMVDTMINDGLWDAFNDIHMGITAENVAVQFDISRQDQDVFAVTSQNRAEAAIKAGKFTDEIVPVVIPQRKGDPVVCSQDEFPRFGTTLEALGKLRSAFRNDGTVTAGNASGINDGAAALVVMSKDKAVELGLTPLATIVSWASAGVDPKIMGTGPIPASRKALAKAGLTVEDMDLVEANEAFASQTLAVAVELKLDMDKTNVNGVAIAVGHPLGASGAILMNRLLYELERRDLRYGLETMCCGGGIGTATIIDRVVE